jgi:hypothetical protein
MVTPARRQVKSSVLLSTLVGTCTVSSLAESLRARRNLALYCYIEG